jgi:DNA invertase Pin-like site-specific DNA recombinase
MKGDYRMKRALSYIRISDGIQKDFIEIQMNQITDYAKQNGYEIVGEYIDEGVTGITMGRPDFSTMMASLSITKPDAIIISEPSRISRNVADLMLFIKEMNQEGIEVLFVRGGFNDYENAR